MDAKNLSFDRDPWAEAMMDANTPDSLKPWMIVCSMSREKEWIRSQMNSRLLFTAILIKLFFLPWEHRCALKFPSSTISN